MSRDGADFAEALAVAQELGYAEANPANDVEGEDARFKLAILASLAFRAQVKPGDIYREGITRLSARDFRYAKELGYAIKLLALARAEPDGIQARVHPAFVPVEESLAKVDGVLNAVQVEADLAGRVLFQGRGAGSLPTTSAVIADMLDAAQSIIGGRRDVPAPDEAPTTIRADGATPHAVLPASHRRRTSPASWRRSSQILGEASISISSVIQKEADEDAQTAELVIMTHVAREESMQAAIAAVEGLEAVQAIGNFVRVEHL